MRGFEGCKRWLTFASIQACCVLLAASSRPASATALEPEAWPRVSIQNPVTAVAVRWALAGASRRLGEARCQALLSDYRDQRQRPLHAKLAELKATGPGYLKLILFRDGSGMAQCERYERLAFTGQGARVVWVCGRRFERLWKENRQMAEATVIHEALHTLGLGENPPSSQAITDHVLDRCFW